MKLHDVVEAYIAFKRALGVRLESEAGVLRAFCRSVGDTDVKDVKPAAVLAFIAGTGGKRARRSHLSRPNTSVPIRFGTIPRPELLPGIFDLGLFFLIVARE